VSPTHPLATAEVGATAAVVADLNPQHVVAGGPGVLGGAGQRLGDGVVGGDLDQFGQPPIEADVEADGDGGAASECRERRFQPTVPEGGRVEATGDLAQFVQRAAGLVGHFIQLCRQLGQRRCLDGAQPPSEGDQPLLRAVVQVALDTPTGSDSGRDDPRPGGGEQLVELGVDEGDGQLAGVQRDGIQAVSGERPAEEPVFQPCCTPCATRQPA
jgi:hypothetical protein